MNELSHPSSPEEPEQQPALDSSEETPIQSSPTSPSLSEVPEETPIQPSFTSPSLSETSEEQPAQPALEDTLIPPASSSDPLAEEIEQQPISSTEPEDTVEVPIEDVEDENEDVEPDSELDEPVFSSLDPSPSGIFIRKSLLIAAACAVVLIALLAALLVFVNHPKDPPTDWIASYTPPAGTSNTGKVLYYLHWTNQNGELKGQMQLAANANGTLQSLTVPATGLYNRDNHIIYVVIIVNGQADTLTGSINDNNDTLTLGLVGSTSQGNQFVFHIARASDYNQATKKLGPGTKTK